jgi:hypothetical protein
VGGPEGETYKSNPWKKPFSFHLTWEAQRERRISQIPEKKQTVGGTMSRKVTSQFSNKDIKYKSRNER